MDRWLERVVAKLVRHGTLTVSTGRGRSFTAGDGTGAAIEIAFRSRWTLLSVLLNPELKLGEAYMDGSFRVVRGSLADFLALVFSQNPPTLPLTFAMLAAAWRYVIRRFAQFNPRMRAREIMANIYREYPDPPNLPRATRDLRDRGSVRRVIRQRLRRRPS